MAALSNTKLYKSNQAIEENDIKYVARSGALDSANYRADREINLAHFKELMKVFKVDILI